MLGGVEVRARLGGGGGLPQGLLHQLIEEEEGGSPVVFLSTDPELQQHWLYNTDQQGVSQLNLSTGLTWERGGLLVICFLASTE